MRAFSVFVGIFLISLVGLGNNQQCYYDVNMELDARAMNCSNVDFGRVAPCCFAGHVCLEQNACFDPTSKATYQLGCTSADYEGDSCPQKCGFDTSKSPWVGLLTTECESSEWICNHPDSCGEACPQDEGIPWRTPPFALPAANCTDMATSVVAFSATNDPLSAFATLPASAGGSSPTNAASSPSPVSSGMSSQTKLGIGLGVGLGGGTLVIAGVIVFLYWRRRNRSQESSKNSDPAPPYPGAPQTAEPYRTDYKPGAYNSEPAPVQNQHFKAELPANFVYPTIGSPSSELHADSSPMFGSPLGSPNLVQQEISPAPPVELPSDGWSGHNGGSKV